MNPGTAPRIVVIGLGNPDRGDDGIGPLVARRAASSAGLPVEPCPPPGPAELLDRWQGADLAVVVDAVRAGDPPGTVKVIEEAGQRAAFDTSTATTHGLGLACALRLAEAIGRAPRRLVLVGVEGRDFSMGRGLSPEVAAVVATAVEAVVGVIKEAQTCA